MIRLVICCIYVLTIIGCTTQPTHLPETPPLIDGIITQTIETRPPTLYLYSVQSTDPADPEFREGWVVVNQDTLIFRQASSQLEPASPAELEPHQHIQIWITGPIYETGPPQVTASHIVIQQP